MKSLFLQVVCFYGIVCSAQPLAIYDDFHRADTSAGVLGTPPTGGQYSLQGFGASTPLTVTRIEDNRWVSQPGEVAYAYFKTVNEVRGIGGMCSWLPGNSGSSPGVFVMVLRPDITPNLQFNASLHVIVQRDVWVIQTVHDGTFSTIASGYFSPMLAANGTSYSFSVLVEGAVAIYNLAGSQGKVVCPIFRSLSGRFAGWEHYYSSASVREVVRVEEVWAL